MALTVVVAYDVSEDRRRAQLAALIQTWGDRIQRSVFVCTLGQEELDELAARMAEIIDTATDSVYILRQCSSCWDEVGIIGQANVDLDEQYYWAVL